MDMELTVSLKTQERHTQVCICVDFKAKTPDCSHYTNNESIWIMI